MNGWRGVKLLLVNILTEHTPSAELAAEGFICDCHTAQAQLCQGIIEIGLKTQSQFPAFKEEVGGWETRASPTSTFWCYR